MDLKDSGLSETHIDKRQEHVNSDKGGEKQFHEFLEEPKLSDFDTDDQDISSFTKDQKGKVVSKRGGYVQPHNTFVSVQSGLQSMPETRLEVISDGLIQDNQSMSDQAHSLKHIHNVNAQRQSTLNQLSFNLHKHHLVAQQEQQKSIKRLSHEIALQGKQIELGKSLLEKVEQNVHLHGATQGKVSQDVDSVRSSISEQEAELARVKAAYERSQEAQRALEVAWTDEEVKMETLRKDTAQSVEEFQNVVSAHGTQQKAYEEQVGQYQAALDAATAKLADAQIEVKEQRSMIQRMTHDKIRADFGIDVSITACTLLFLHKFFASKWANQQVAGAILGTYVAIDGQRLQWTRGMLKKRTKYMYWLLVLLEAMVGIKTIRRWAIARGYHSNTGDLPEYIQLIWDRLFGTGDHKQSLLGKIAGTGYALVAGTYNSVMGLFYKVDTAITGQDPEK